MPMPPPPPKLESLTAGAQLRAGLGVSTIYGDFDFETYSPAGFIWNSETNKFEAPSGAQKKGLFAVGAAAYTEHPEAEVLSLAYNLKDGRGNRLWIPGQPNPTDLFDYIKKGFALEAWNVSFENWVWVNICQPKYDWPVLPMSQLRCAMAKARAFGLPGSLEMAGNVLNIQNKKDKDGKRLLEKFSIPRNPTKLDPRLRIHPVDDTLEAQALYKYNIRDIEAEAEISSRIPDLTPDELAFWQCDQQINFRGVCLDKNTILNCIAIVEQAHDRYNAELQKLTNGAVNSASEIQRLRNWMFALNVKTTSLDAESLDQLLKEQTLPDDVRRALEIRALIGSAAVKKLYSMLNQLTKSNRVHDLFIYHSARTGRAAGTGPQPQNLPNSGPAVDQCSQCKKYFNDLNGCPWCGHLPFHRVTEEWNPMAVEHAIETIASSDLDCVEYYWKDAIAIISGCLRGLFIASPGHDLMCSDYSAIEAVVLAMLSGEEWRIEVFRTHGKIYEMSASKITGIPFEEFIRHKKETGQHHPMRKKTGKVSELASGFGGWVGAWIQFGADEFFTEEEIKQAILAWRRASPKIVEFWGGQERNWQTEYYGLEGCAVQAVLTPGHEFSHRDIVYYMQGDILYCRLLSGRYLTYHRPRLEISARRSSCYSLSFEGWNTNPKNGLIGWLRMYTYGGKLTENVVQATARDILAHAIVKLEKANYKVVLHIHDEIVVEVPENWGSLEEFEAVINEMPAWAKNWPIKASGGWRAKRYAK